MSIDKVLAKADASKMEHTDALFRLLRQPSISAQDYGMRDCAELVADTLEVCGIRARLIPTPGNPVVFGEIAATSPDAPTILFYGHYDVQPPDPIEEWTSLPFEPTVRDGRIYARGAGDNKGQFIAHALAVHCYMQALGQVPVNIKMVVEGEEESGSPNLGQFVEANRNLLSADLVFVADGSYEDWGRPAVCTGVRGMLAVELEAQGARIDQHSGNRGGMVPHPTWELIDLLHTMRSADGRVHIEGFYEDIREPDETELAYARHVPFDPQRFADVTGLQRALVSSPAEYARRLMFEPTFNIAGFVSGYSGKGIKTIIPSRALMKIDMRLIVDQDPDWIYQLTLAHVRKHAPNVEIRRLGSMRPSRTPILHSAVQATIRAVRAVHGREPALIPSLGGSLPNYVWTETLKIPTVMVPYANSEENNHAPNESIELEAFFAGIRTSIQVIEAMRNLKED